MSSTPLVDLLHEVSREHYARTATELPAFLVTEMQRRQIDEELRYVGVKVGVIDHVGPHAKLFGIPLLDCSPTVPEARSAHRAAADAARRERKRRGTGEFALKAAQPRRPGPRGVREARQVPRSEDNYEQSDRARSVEFRRPFRPASRSARRRAVHRRTREGDIAMTVTLLHGSCLDLIPAIDREVNCVLTDPPYGVDFVSRRAATPDGKKWVNPIENDRNLEQALELFKDTMDLLLPKCATQAELYVFTRWDIVAEWTLAVSKIVMPHGFKYKMLLVWDKGVPGMGDIDANWGCGHELILYFKRGLRDVPYRRSGIIAVDKVANTKHIHPTQKPVGLLEKLIEMSTDKGDLVVDPFAGSGSTLEAARNRDRDAIGFELDDLFFARASERLEHVGFAFE